MAKTRSHKWTISAPIGTRIVGAEICGNGRGIQIFSETKVTDFFTPEDKPSNDVWKFPMEGLRCISNSGASGFHSNSDCEYPMEEGLRSVPWF